VADPNHHEAEILLAEICVEDGALDEAEQILSRLSALPGDADARVTALIAKVDLIRKNAGVDTSALQARIEAEPDNHALRIEYANALAGKQDWRGALEQLLTSVKKDKTWNEGATRKAMIELFQLLASDEAQQPLVREFRTKLAGVLN
jgi:putative thioredoxin